VSDHYDWIFVLTVIVLKQVGINPPPQIRASTLPIHSPAQDMNQKAAAIDRTDRQTDTRPFHRPSTTGGVTIQNWLQFSFLVKATAFKAADIGSLPQFLCTEENYHICAFIRLS